MVTLARTTSGLLYRSDGSLAGWTGQAQWTSVSAVRLIASPSVPISPCAILSQTKGEPKWESVGGVWYISYDDLRVGSRSVPAIQRSLDRGITWQDLGPIKFAAAIPASGVAVNSHYLDPVSSTWYMHVQSGSSLTPGDGLNSPYQYYIYQSSGDITGPYTQVNEILPTTGTWCDQSSQSGSCYYDGTDYWLYGAGNQPAAWAVPPYTGNPINVLGVWKTTSLTATPTQPTPSTPLIDITNTGPVQPEIFGIENASLGYNPVLNLFVLAANTDINDGTNAYSYATVYATSTTPGGFTSAGWKMMQWPCPADANVILDVTQFLHNGANSVMAIGPNGEMAAICSNQISGGPFTPYYSNLRPVMSVIEPAAALLRYTGSADTTLRGLSRSLSHTDITIELASELTGVNGSGGSLVVAYRSDGTGNNEYRATLATSGKWSLVKVVSGTPTTIATGTGTQSYDNKGAPDGFLHRLKVQVIGNTHAAALDGETQYTHTDSSSPLTSGTTLTVYAEGLNCDLINLSCRTSDTIRVNGMQPGTSVWLRAACGIPIAPIVANSSGVGTISYQHFPLYSLDIAGTDYTVGTDSRIWGGDTLQFSGLPESAPAMALSTSYS